MGAMQAASFAEAVSDGEVSLDQALSWHLSANHYPPVPSEMLGVCKAAIEAVNDGLLEARLVLPAGVSFRGEPTVEAWQAVESFHLEAFLEPGEY